jgi:multidrug efflux pump subunit AcrB
VSAEYPAAGDGGATGMEGVKPGLIAYFAGNPVAANLLMAVIAIVGLLAGSRLVLRDVPAIDPHLVEISVTSPGSSAREVEEEIVRRVEEAVLGIAGVDRVLGTAAAELGTVVVEYSPLSDGAAVLHDVENAVDSIENFPPPAAKEPEIDLLQPEVTAVTLAVSSEHLDREALQSVAEGIRGELVQLSGISEVSLRGARDGEVSIELEEEQLRRYGLSFETIAARVRGSSLNLSFGELDTQSGQVALHTVSKRQTGEQFADIPLVTKADGTIIRLGDVARIRDAFAPDDQVVLTVNGVSAVLVTVGVAPWQSLTDTAALVREWLAGYAPPPNITVSVWDDTAGIAVDRMSTILRNVAIGVALVFICLILVLDLRVAIWVALGIPLAFVGSLMLVAAFGLTINVVTIAAFFLMVGLVVDDALIVAENIDAERAANPRRPRAAAVRGARAVVGPITVGAITTALAFVPLLFSVGQVQPMAILPYIVASVLAISLIEALLILPAHLSHHGNWTLPPLRELQAYVSGLLTQLRERTVAPVVSWAVRHVWTTFAAAGVFVLGAVVLLATGSVRFITFTGTSNTLANVRADLYLPVGTPFATTLATAERVADAGTALDEAFGGGTVHGVSVFVGNLFSEPSEEDEVHDSHLASVMLHVTDTADRTASVADVEAAWARRIGDIPLLERFEVSAQVSSAGNTIDYALHHDDESMLQTATGDLTSYLASTAGVSGVWDSLAPGKRHIDIQVTPAGQVAGLTPAAIGRQLRANYHGLEVQELQRGADEVKVVLRYPHERRRSLQELWSERIHLPASGDAEMPLSTAATLTERREPAILTRIDGKRAARVSANFDPSLLTIRQLHGRVEQELLPALQAAHPGLRLELDGYGREERTLFATAAVTVPAVLLAMYALIAAFLRSYWKPLVAVVGFPLAFAGAVFGHWLLGWDFGGVSFFGVVAVSGVVVNDALVLLDRYNTIRRENSTLPAIAAVAAATRNRFRAVFLTTVTTLVGLCPMLYERSDLLIFLVPFVVSMVGGLILSGVFTLFILPALVMAVDGRGGGTTGGDRGETAREAANPQPS